jgi:hypothetical protein
MNFKGLDIDELLEQVRNVSRKLSKDKAGKEFWKRRLRIFRGLEPLYAWMCTIATSQKCNKRSYGNS